MTAEQIKDLAVGALGGGGLAVAAKAVWQLMTRRQALRQMDAQATMVEVQSLELPFRQATEVMKMLREDLEHARERAAELERILSRYRRIMIENGITLPEDGL